MVYDCFSYWSRGSPRAELGSYSSLSPQYERSQNVSFKRYEIIKM